MRSFLKVRKALELYKEGVEKVGEAERVLSSGPASYYFKTVEGYVEALFNRFAPFQEGDRVKIIKAPNTNNAWHRCRHFLKRGTVGTVHSVDYRENKFCAEIIWDIETWIDDKGKERPVSDKSLFLMWEGQIKRQKNNIS